jgi:hypothetical protein
MLKTKLIKRGIPGLGAIVTTNSFQAVGDVGINTSDTSTPTHNKIFGLITWAHVRQLNNQVSSFLASYSSYLDNRKVYSILLLRNDG